MVVFSMMIKTIKITMFDVNDDYSEVLSVMMMIMLSLMMMMMMSKNYKTSSFLCDLKITLKSLVVRAEYYLLRPCRAHINFYILCKSYWSRCTLRVSI